MPHMLDTKQFLDAIVAMLEDGKGCIPVPVAGTSMCPFLHPGDTVFLDPPGARLRRGDIVLFTRPDGSYVLHRIASVNPDGSLEMLGDAQTRREHVAGRDRICAVVCHARLGDRLISPHHPRWRFYQTVWLWAAPLRPLIFRIHQIFCPYEKR